MSRSWLAALDLELGRYADARLPLHWHSSCGFFMLHSTKTNIGTSEFKNLRCTLRRRDVMLGAVAQDCLVNVFLAVLVLRSQLSPLSPVKSQNATIWQRGFSFPVATPTGYLHCWPYAMPISMPGPRAWMLFLALNISLETCRSQVYDHYRVLRVVPRIVIHSMSVDFCAQAPRQTQKGTATRCRERSQVLLAPACGILQPGPVQAECMMPA